MNTKPENVLFAFLERGVIERDGERCAYGERRLTMNLSREELHSLHKEQRQIRKPVRYGFSESISYALITALII